MRCLPVSIAVLAAGSALTGLLAQAAVPVTVPLGQAPASAQGAAPKASKSLLAAAEQQRLAGDLGGAERLLGQALKRDPTSVATHNALGDLLLGQHRFLEAMMQFEAALDYDAHSARAREGERAATIASALEAKRDGRPDEALQTLNRGRAAVPEDVTLLTDLGVQAQSMHRLPLAADVLHRALALDANNATALYALARTESDQGDFPTAETHFRAYLALRPNDASAYFGLGDLYQKQLRADDAKAQFEHSIALQPVQTESYYHLGELALEAGETDEARRRFRKTLERMPAHGGALTGMGMLAFRAKQYPEARRYLEQAVASSPDYQPAHYYLGLTLARLGDKPASEAELKRATELATEQQGKGKPIPNP